MAGEWDALLTYLCVKHLHRLPCELAHISAEQIPALLGIEMVEAELLKGMAK